MDSLTVATPDALTPNQIKQKPQFLQHISSTLSLTSIVYKTIVVPCTLNSFLSQLHIIRAHSFPRPAKFRAEPWHLGFCRRIEPRNFTPELFFRGMPRNLTFFIRTTIFSQKMTSK